MGKELKKAFIEVDIPSKLVQRTRNIFALGITYWLFNRPIEPTVSWINKKFKGKEDVIMANIHSLQGGWNFAEKNPDFRKQYIIDKSALPPGKYRSITGSRPLRWACGSRGKGTPAIVFSSYLLLPRPIFYMLFQGISNMV
jgi:2-oxoglutarate ferredoxin oxidoreductase subunit alpha